MNYEAYSDLDVTDDLHVVEFVSVGRHGSILKRIAFVPTKYPMVVNLAFGDIISDDEIDDKTISDNGDRNKILATVANVVKLFTDVHPEKMIYFKGSTEERTRLYRIAVGLNLEELSENFEIYAEVGDNEDFVPFCKNMVIKAFLIKRKLINFIS